MLVVYPQNVINVAIDTNKGLPLPKHFLLGHPLLIDQFQIFKTNATTPPIFHPVSNGVKNTTFAKKRHQLDKSNMADVIQLNKA